MRADRSGTPVALSGGMNHHHSAWIVLKNGLHRRCPQCGRGPLLDGWFTAREQCSACGLVYERHPGDTWAFWIIGDRVPVALAIAVVYVGMGPRTWAQGALFLAALATLLIATIPQRSGLVYALDYLSRLYWPDPDDTSVT